MNNKSNLLTTILWIGFFVVVYLATPYVGFLTAWNRLLAAQPALQRGLLVIMIAAMILGGVTMLAGGFLIRVPDDVAQGRVTTWRSSGKTRSRPAGSQKSTAATFEGQSVGVEIDDEDSLSGLKAALIEGAWWTNPRWLRFVTVGAGAFVMAAGLLGVFFVVGTAFIQLLILCVAGYTAIRLGLAFRKA